MSQRTEYSPNNTEDYLTILEELTLEVKCASIAVKTGALTEFERSLKRQQISCAQLTQMMSQWPPNVTALSDPLLSLASQSMADRIRTASAALRAETLSYSLLLKHFGETTRLFSGIYRRYGSVKDDLFFHPTHGAWSCEL